MAITSSAKKAIRVSKRKRIFNVRTKKSMDEALKSFRQLIAKKDKSGAEKAISSVYQTLDKAVKTGYIKVNASSRLKSRAMASLKKLG
jgi:ribosomal protein S20